MTFLTSAARHYGLLRDLEGFAPCKQRDRSASDQENNWSLIACLASGRGKLRDLDEVRADEAVRKTLGLAKVSSSRRIGEWLSRLQPHHIASLQRIATRLANRLTPMLVEQHVAERDYVPVFIDGTAIEVSGDQFEQAEYNYGDAKQYWLHAAFVGKLQVSGRLASGHKDAVGDWRTQLNADLESIIPADKPVWVAMDNAYYRGDLTAHLDDLGWAWSISVTNPNTKRPVLRLMHEDAPFRPLPDSDDEAVHDVWYQPSGWSRPVRYVVIRRQIERDGERDLFPQYTVIATSDDRLPMAEVVKRHRSKQGWENGFKGPLSEMDLHHPPTSNMGGNQLYYICGLIAQQLLVAVQFGMLPAAARDCGLHPLIRDVIGTVGKLTRTARRSTLWFAKSNLQLGWLLQVCWVQDEWWQLSPGRRC